MIKHIKLLFKKSRKNSSRKSPEKKYKTNRINFDLPPQVGDLIELGGVTFSVVATPAHAFFKPFWLLTRTHDDLPPV